MPPYIVDTALMLIIAALLLLTKQALPHGPKTLMALVALIGAITTLATVFLQYSS